MSQNQLRHGGKDTMAWLTDWGIDENDISQNIDNAKDIITSKFKDKLWSEEKLAVTITRLLIITWKMRSISRYIN